MQYYTFNELKKNNNKNGGEGDLPEDGDWGWGTWSSPPARMSSLTAPSTAWNVALSVLEASPKRRRADDTSDDSSMVGSLSVYKLLYLLLN